ncbi:MAG: O-antigen ligase family protein [Staphylococcus sp.]|nr:O-antigen ligase family protein [Staphylococcus sp.]
MYIILALGYVEAGIGILQWMGVMHSHHRGYVFTGTFYNPGPYACFLAVVVPLAVFMMREAEGRVIRYAATGIVLLGAVLIPATLSRTALLAVVVGSAVAMSDCIREYLRKFNLIWALAAVGLAVVLVVGLYAVKKDSADGRLLIWKVAAEAVGEVPLTGVGWDNVAGAYGEAQERYFAAGNGSEQEMMVADAPEYVFNEYLQVMLSFGPLAGVVLVVLLAGGFLTALRGRAYGYAGSVAAVAIVMFASYPLQFPFFTAIICLILAGCCLQSPSKWLRMAGCSVVVVCGAMFLTNSHREDVGARFSVGHAQHRQQCYRQSNDMLLDLLSKSSDPMILNIIGKNYQALGMPDSAEYYFRKSVNRCPNRLYPHYLLMLLYSDSINRDRNKMIKEAEILITKKEKIASPAVEEMQQKAREILSNETSDSCMK